MRTFRAALAAAPACVGSGHAAHTLPNLAADSALPAAICSNNFSSSELFFGVSSSSARPELSSTGEEVDREDKPLSPAFRLFWMPGSSSATSLSSTSASSVPEPVSPVLRRLKRFGRGRVILLPRSSVRVSLGISSGSGKFCERSRSSSVPVSALLGFAAALATLPLPPARRAGPWPFEWPFPVPWPFDWPFECRGGFLAGTYSSEELSLEVGSKFSKTVPAS
mmetsp:Transcript_99265/g.176821  ORF Transcript_99265/g.176821 Transcript_99265/m.176821 type:complete len:223 (-) Transcript_99265:454-1122(-)